MIIFDTFQTALVQLSANKLRTGLTMLGIVIGVGAVIALMAAGQGAQQGVTKEVSALGSNLLFVEPGTTEQSGGPVRFSATTLTTDDAEALKSLPYVDAVISEFDLDIENQLVGNGRNTTAGMTATEPDFTYVRSWEVQAGRFISDEDVSRKATNVVLGAQVAEDLLDTPENAIGQDVRLSFGPFSLNLTVVGVMEERGAAGTGEDDSQILLPLTTFRARVPFGRAAGGSENVQQIVVKATGGGKVDDAKEDIRALLLERHDYEEDFTVQTQNDLTATARDVSRTLTILLGAIAGISLVVGGIGIMNIMLVSVTERTREIGIRKAVGASSGDILLQFVVEAVIVTLVSGAAGVLAGVVAARVADGQDFGTGSSVTTVVAPWSIFVALGVSVLIGLFFGIYPAFRASRLNPIEALRAE
ncbi:MAG TPA: ABC transporter permease [Dehalococcoidia bacterium]|nr:ABC transporter permease [Dehalococcoidia bacterium]